MEEEKQTEIQDPDLKGLQVKLGEQKFQQIRDQTSFINNKFKNRRKKYREKLLQPPTPTKDELDQLELEVEENLKTKILIQDDFSIKNPYQGLSFLKKYQKKIFLDAIHPQSGAMTYWYLILMSALLYNAYVIPLRVCFTPYQTEVSSEENRKDNWILSVSLRSFRDLIANNSASRSSDLELCTNIVL